MNSDSDDAFVDFDDDEENRVGLDKFFAVNSSTRLVHCRVRDCKTTFKAWKKYNFKRHLRNQHESVYTKLFPTEADEIKKLEMSSLELVLNAVELVTINGQPFSILDASALKGFCKQTVDELNAKRFRVNLCRNTIANRVDEISKEIISMIKEELKDRFICLMLDTCTKGTLSVLSINAQYMIDDEIIIRSLGVIELTERHTAVQLTKRIQEHLQQVYDVAMTQVKAVVTDNAENMRLTRKLINKLALGESIEQCENDSEDNEESDEEVINEEGHPSADDELEMMNILNNNDEYSDLIKESAAELVRYYGSLLASNPISCSTHTYQLAIKDSLIVTNATAIINKVNDLCKLVRTQVVQIKLKQLGVRVIKPPLKNITRWNSDFLMVNYIYLFNVHVYNKLIVYFFLAERISAFKTKLGSSGRGAY